MSSPARVKLYGYEPAAPAGVDPRDKQKPESALPCGHPPTNDFSSPSASIGTLSTNEDQKLCQDVGAHHREYAAPPTRPHERPSNQQGNYFLATTHGHSLNLIKFFGSKWPIWELLTKLETQQGTGHIRVVGSCKGRRSGQIRQLQTTICRNAGSVYNTGVSSISHRRCACRSLLSPIPPDVLRLRRQREHETAQNGFGYSSGEELTNSYESPLFKLKDRIVKLLEEKVQLRRLPAEGERAKKRGALRRFVEDQLKVRIVDVGAIMTRGQGHVYHTILAQNLAEVIGFEPNEMQDWGDEEHDARSKIVDPQRLEPNTLLYPYFI